MYLAIDVGGTKTLAAVFSEDGQIQASEKFPTPLDYQQFLVQMSEVAKRLCPVELIAACVAIPGVLTDDRANIETLGNLPWVNASVQTDCQEVLKCPVLIENDAKLAGLSEARLLGSAYRKVLYVTFSTGVGIGLTTDGEIDQSIGDRGGKGILLEHDGKLVDWESFASGKAIVARYGKRASEIDDPAIWKAISTNFAIGLIDLIGLLEPDIIVIGGGVGTHFEKFEQPLKTTLESMQTRMITIPPIVKAQHAEEAVIYGCYDYIKTHHA